MAPLPSAYPAMKPMTAPISPSSSPHSLSRRASVGAVDIGGRVVLTTSTSAPRVYASRMRSRRVHPWLRQVRTGIRVAVRREVLHDRAVERRLLLNPCGEVRRAHHHRGVVGHVAVPEPA